MGDIGFKFKGMFINIDDTCFIYRLNDLIISTKKNKY